MTVEKVVFNPPIELERLFAELEAALKSRDEERIDAATQAVVDYVAARKGY